MQGSVALESIVNRIEVLEEIESDLIFAVSPINASREYITLSMIFTVQKSKSISTKKLDDWWKDKITPHLNGVNLVPFIITRPGYFKRSY
jgi:hypothetical protein